MISRFIVIHMNIGPVRIGINRILITIIRIIYFLFRNAFGSIFTLFLFLTLNLFSQILLSLRCDIHQNISILLLIHLPHIYSHTNASHSQTFLCTSNRTEYNKTISFGLPCNMIATQCEFFNLSLQIMEFLKSSQTCRIHVQYLPHEYYMELHGRIICVALLYFYRSGHHGNHGDHGNHDDWVNCGQHHGYENVHQNGCEHRGDYENVLILYPHAKNMGLNIKRKSHPNLDPYRQ